MTSILFVFEPSV